MSQEIRYASGTVVFNETMKVLLVSSSKDRSVFVLPKGGVEQGLSDFENAMKEVQEEAGAMYMPICEIPPILHSAMRTKDGVTFRQSEHYYAGIFLSYCEWPESHIRSRMWVRIEEIDDYLNATQAEIVRRMHKAVIHERRKPDFDSSENIVKRTSLIGETIGRIRDMGYALQSGIEGEQVPLSEFKQAENRIKRDTPRNSGFGQTQNSIIQQLVSPMLMHEMMGQQIRELQSRGYGVDTSMLAETGVLYIQTPPGYDEKIACDEVLNLLGSSVQEIGPMITPKEVRDQKGGEPFRPDVHVIDYDPSKHEQNADQFFERGFSLPVDLVNRTERGHTPHIVPLDDSPFQNVSGSASVIRSGFENSAEMKAHSNIEHPRGESVYHSCSDDRYYGGNDSDSGGASGCD